MEDYFGVTDNSVSTQHRYDLIAKHQVRAYSSAMRKHNEQEKATDFIFSILGKLVWYLLINPILVLLKILSIWVWDKIKASNRISDD